MNPQYPVSEQNVSETINIDVPHCDDRDAGDVVVSFIVPVYKVEPEFLRECLDSIAGQTLKNIEVLCVDNASPDGSGRILREYAEKDRRFKLIVLKENRKSAGGRNAAYPYVRGKFIQFVDCDDTVSPDLCERTVSEAEALGADVVVFDNWASSAPGAPYYSFKGHDPCYDLDSEDGHRFFTEYTLIWDRLWRTEFIMSNNLRCPEGVFCEDVWFVWNALLCGGKFVRIPEILYTWRPRATSTTRSQSNPHLDVVPETQKIKAMLVEKGRYEEFRKPFHHMQSLLIFNSFHNLNRHDLKTRNEFIEQIAPISGECLDYLSDAYSDLARRNPVCRNGLLDLFQSIANDGKGTKTPLARRLKARFKSLLKRMLRPFQRPVYRIVDILGREHRLELIRHKTCLDELVRIQAQLQRSLSLERMRTEELRGQLGQMMRMIENMEKNSATKPNDVVSSEKVA